LRKTLNNLHAFAPEPRHDQFAFCFKHGIVTSYLKTFFVELTTMNDFRPNGLPLLIGSLPLRDHKEAVQLVLDHTPEIPLWVQLPCYPDEGMIPQFLEGFPGYKEDLSKNQVNATDDAFDEEMLAFFEDYLTLSEPDSDLNGSRFALTGIRAKGFTEFLRQVDEKKSAVYALKGQVTGPITFCTAVKDQDGKDIFYNDQLRDAAIKKLALNARWQAHEFARRGAVPIIFIDEPSLSGFGTSAYITITKEDVTQSIEEICLEIHAADGLAGVHVCGNTQWDILLNAAIDIISFDAFAYFDRFILYPQAIKAYLNRGGILAWGIVPTLDSEKLAVQTTDGLIELLNNHFEKLTAVTGVDAGTLLSQSLITPSCGAGSLSLELAQKALHLTREISDRIRIENH
jgi:methionine synthase II (cobalamin-independent)